MHRLIDVIHKHAEDAITALAAAGLFGVFGALWRGCAAVIGG